MNDDLEFRACGTNVTFGWPGRPALSDDPYEIVTPEQTLSRNTEEAARTVAQNSSMRFPNHPIVVRRRGKEVFTATFTPDSK